MTSEGKEGLFEVYLTFFFAITYVKFISRDTDLYSEDTVYEPLAGSYQRLKELYTKVTKSLLALG